MKKLFFLFIILLLALSFSSCKKEASAEEMLREFIYSYGVEGIVYTPTARLGEQGYVYDGLTEKIFVYSGEFPQNYAVLLNFRSSYGGECGVFVCDDSEEWQAVSEMCEERVALLSRGEGGIVLRSRGVIFYSTLDDSKRAEEIWYKILRAHT